MGLVENAAIKTWPARKLRMDHHAIMRAARTEPLRPLRTEDRHNGHIQEVRKMHRAAVVANKKPTVRKYGQKTTKIEIHRVQPLHCGNIARTAGLREPQHVRVGFAQDTARNFGEAFF